MNQHNIRAFNGKMVVLNDEGDMEFHATRSTGQSSQIVIAKTKNSKLYMTTGKKHPQLVAHLTTLNEVPDRAAALQDELDRLSKSITLKPLRTLQGKFLLKDDNASVVHNKRRGKLEVRLLIDLTATPNVQQTLIKRMQEISACLATNSITLAKLKN